METTTKSFSWFAIQRYVPHFVPQHPELPPTTPTNLGDAHKKLKARTSNSFQQYPNSIQYPQLRMAASLTLKEFFAQKAAPKIISICGSQRDGSFNKMLHDYAVTALKKNGAIVTTIDLGVLGLPLYDPNEDEKNFPAAAQDFKNQLVESDGIFIASPEYNGFTSPLLYNAITWATRGEGSMYAGFQGKVVTVMATSPGPMGGLRMVRSLDQMMQDMGAVVVPGSNAIGSAFNHFDKDGNIQDDRTKAKIDTTCANLVHFCRYEANRETDCAVAKEVLKNMGEYGEVDLP